MKIAVSHTRLIGPSIAPEQFISEHLFFYLEKGIINGYYGTKSYTLRSGQGGLLLKNSLARQIDGPLTGDLIKIIFVLDEMFLKAFQEKHSVNATRFQSSEGFVRMNDKSLIPPFLRSLGPYYNEQGQIDRKFFDLKRDELLLILLQLQPDLAGVLFDFSAPHKIDLRAFMNLNFRFNVSTRRFAYLTGRSLSAFKRDFSELFNETPRRWLMKRRLEEAQFLIFTKNKKPADIYLDLGFETLSHFSFAFKKHFGMPPTMMPEQSNRLHPPLL